MLRTPDDIKRFLQQRKELNQRKKEKELKRYRKAQESTKKQLKHKTSTNIIQTPEKPIKITCSITIYQSPIIERFPDEENLYHTREEIDNDDSGSINWDFFDKLLDKFRKTL